MKKRIITAVIALALIIASLSGCGSSATTPTPTPTPETAPVVSDEIVAGETETETAEGEKEPGKVVSATSTPAASAKPQTSATPAPTTMPTQTPQVPTSTPTQAPTATPVPTPTPTPAPSLSANEVAEKMLGALPETGNLMLMPEEYYKDVYMVDPANYDSVSVYGAMINVKANEIIVIKAKDAASVANAKADLTARLAALDEIWKRYLPDQYELVKAGKIVTKGLYVALVVADGAQNAVNAFNSAL